jgi:hypothetical protein
MAEDPHPRRGEESSSFSLVELARTVRLSEGTDAERSARLPALRAAPWILVAAGLGLVVFAIAMRTQLWVTSSTTETVETRPLTPDMRPSHARDATIATRRSTTTAPPSDALLGVLVGIGATLLLAGVFYRRISEVSLPGGPALRFAPEPQAFPPSPAIAVASEEVPAEVGPAPFELTPIVRQEAFTLLDIEAAQVQLAGEREVRVAVLSAGDPTELLTAPALATRVEQPLNLVEEWEPGLNLMNSQLGLVAALAPSARILPVNVLGRGGRSALERGLEAVLEWSAEVVFLDFGLPTKADGHGGAPPGQELVDELLSRFEPSVLLIAPAGNDPGLGTGWPAERDHVLAVAGTDADGELAPWSPERADIAAPGVDVLSLFGLEDGELRFDRRSGTALAAGVTTGLAALGCSARRHLPAAVVGSLLAQTGRPVSLGSARFPNLPAFAAVLPGTES